MPGWDDHPIGEALRERFDVPILVENDANAMALGEWWSFWRRSRVADPGQGLHRHRHRHRPRRPDLPRRRGGRREHRPRPPARDRRPRVHLRLPRLRRLAGQRPRPRRRPRQSSQPRRGPPGARGRPRRHRAHPGGAAARWASCWPPRSACSTRACWCWPATWRRRGALSDGHQGERLPPEPAVHHPQPGDRDRARWASGRASWGRPSPSWSTCCPPPPSTPPWPSSPRHAGVPGPARPAESPAEAPPPARTWRR